MRDNHRESRCYSWTRLWLDIELFEFCGSFLDLVHEPCIKGAHHVRAEC